jgi:2-polyprenyl-3-methyl-5-hydroxy-6-metoxy-1,4-benzoquinol methylase
MADSRVGGGEPREVLLGTASRLSTSLEALAALAAHLRVEGESLDVEPRVRELLSEVAAELLGEPREVPGPAKESVVGMTRAFLRQATDLVENPGRSGGWDQPDEVLLQGLGRLSMAIVDAVRAAEGVLDGLGPRLAADNATFLDVGTGTGWLAIAMARAYPHLRVVGIDIFEPALALARRNVAGEGLDGRVELRLQDAADLAGDHEHAGYDVIWLPMPFLPAAVVPQVLRSCAEALRPGGWVLLGTFGGPSDRLSQLLIDLRTVRSGGHPWQPQELLQLIADHGFTDACEVPRTWAAPVRLYAGRR